MDSSRSTRSHSGVRTTPTLPAVSWRNFASPRCEAARRAGSVRRRSALFDNQRARIPFRPPSAERADAGWARNARESSGNTSSARDATRRASAEYWCHSAYHPTQVAHEVDAACATRNEHLLPFQARTSLPNRADATRRAFATARTQQDDGARVCESLATWAGSLRRRVCGSHGAESLAPHAGRRRRRAPRRSRSVRHVRAGDERGERHAAPVGQNMPCDASLRAVRWLRSERSLLGAFSELAMVRRFANAAGTLSPSAEPAPTQAQ